MKTKPLSQTNPYLKDRKQREASIKASVLSSSAVEGIHIKSLDNIKDTKK